MTYPKDLIEAAVRARANAHAPYSNYQVGCALRSADGAIIPGCNVEFLSFGLTVCAERGALVNAIATGHKKIIEIAVVTENGGSCCGMCRQAIWDLCGDVPVYLADAAGNVRMMRSSEMLPSAYGSEPKS